MLETRALLASAVIVLACACSAPAGPDDPAIASPAEEALGGRPAEIDHSDADTPLPSWSQLVREGASPYAPSAMQEHVVRILAPGAPRDARARFESWPPTVRRGFAILMDKLYNEGWLDEVDRMENDPWDTAFHFRPRDLDRFEKTMHVKADHDGVYTENSWWNGAAAYLTRAWNHSAWRVGWMENDVSNAALHVGIFDNGVVEVHMELYNPLYTNGAPFYELVGAPGVGWMHGRMTYMHKTWEAGAEGKNRTSANYYHFVKGAGWLGF